MRFFTYTTLESLSPGGKFRARVLSGAGTARLPVAICPTVGGFPLPAAALVIAWRALRPGSEDKK
jgi:hypothetical protein